LKKLTVTIPATFLTAVLGCFLCKSAFSADETTIKIGHVAAMSGPIAHLGKDNDNGAKLAIEELNAKGIKINGKKVTFVLLSEDDAGDPKQGTAVAQKLVDAKVNGVVGHLNSGTSIPASKIYHAAGIPQIAPSVTSMGYNAQGYKSTFRDVANDGQLGAELANYAKNVLRAKTVAVIDDRTAYGQGIADQFVNGLKSSGGDKVKMLPRQFTTSKATDFNAILTTIKAKKPDLIFLGAMDSTAGPMLRQMKALGIKTKFMGGDGICTEQLSALAGEALGEEQIICAVAGGVTDAEKKGYEGYIAAYKKRFGTDIQLYSPYVYDAVMTLADAMQQAESSDPAVYLPFLRKIKHKGVTGDISFDEKGNLKNGYVSLYTYKKGGAELISVMKLK
jgi:branched-chain amino acid transport system substrate-binding protein